MSGRIPNYMNGPIVLNARKPLQTCWRRNEAVPGWCLYAARRHFFDDELPGISLSRFLYSQTQISASRLFLFLFHSTFAIVLLLVVDD
jgi:hypothetical protein